jgi:hypothetical protein
MTFIRIYKRTLGVENNIKVWNNMEVDKKDFDGGTK